MHSKLHALFDKLEAQRSQMEMPLRQLRGDQFNEHPFAGKWSVQELLGHIIASERLSVEYLKKKTLAKATAKNTWLWHDLKLVVLQISQRMPFKFKAPKTIVQRTQVYRDPVALLADWALVRGELRQILEGFDEPDLMKKIFRHVYAGRLNIQHAVKFLYEHIAHHKPQLDRLLKNLKTA